MTHETENEVVEPIAATETTTETVDTETTEPAEEKTAEQLEIERLTAENEALADKVLRAQAELQNVQRRQIKERQDLLKYRSQKLAEELLPVLDSLDRALAIEVSDEQGEALKKGIEMAHASFMAALKNEGVEPIEAVNQPFNPNWHQAIQQVAADGVEKDTITQEFQKGYTLHERVLRPSMVVVAE